MLSRKQIFPLALVFYEVLVYLSTDMYLPALPKVSQEFAITSHETQNALSIWFLGAGCCQWFAGPLSDYYGRRPVLLTSILIYVLACICCATTHDYNLFLTARFVQGGMIGPIFVGGYAAIHEEFNSNEAIKILAVMSCVTIFAPTVGPMLGAIIIDNHKWQLLFQVLALCSGLTGIILLFCMPETLEHKVTIDLRSITKSYLKIIKSRLFNLPVLANCYTFSAMITWLTMSAFISSKQGFTAKEYGIMQLIVFGAYIIGNRSISLLIDRYPKQKIIKFGLYFAGIFGSMSFMAFNLNPNIKLGILTIACITLGAGMCGPNLQKLAMENSEQPMGIKLGVYSTLISITGALTSFIVSQINNTWNLLITAMLTCIIIAAVLNYTWGKLCQK